MTLDEAKTVASILIGADGGCYHCASDLFESAQLSFPEFNWVLYDGTRDSDWNLKFEVTLKND